MPLPTKAEIFALLNALGTRELTPEGRALLEQARADSQRLSNALGLYSSQDLADAYEEGRQAGILEERTRTAMTGRTIPPTPETK